jgi:hypothetical protein
MPSPFGMSSSTPASSQCVASASRARQAASPMTPYGGSWLPVASLTASTSSSSATAEVTSPANACTPARAVSAMGSTDNAPASRASRTCRSHSASQLSKSHITSAAWDASRR